MKTLKFAYLYAKSITLLPTHDDRTNAVMMRNRRIGCSMSGIVQAMEKFGRRQFFQMCDVSYSYLDDLDKVYSDWLCVPRSIKRTSVKPSGTVSLLPGVTPGIHFPHSEYYIRRIRIKDSHPLVEAAQLCDLWVEKDKYSPNTSVVSFPIHEKHFTRSKQDVTMWEQLEIAAQVQEHWADNAVSATVTFHEHEAKDIKHALELYETRLKGVSFLPHKHGFEQAPYETITKEEYDRMISSANLAALPKMLAQLSTQNTHDQLERFCDGDVCTV